MKKRRFLKYPVLLTAILLSTGCVGLTEKIGRALDGSAFKEKTIALYRAQGMEISVAESRSAEQSVIITIKKFPMIKLRASVPQDGGHFFLTSLEYLAGSAHGWNEYTLELIGNGTLYLGDTAILEGINNIEPGQITAARIHRYDSRITGPDALSALRRRRERIAAIGEWMLSLNGPQDQSIKNFENYWKPVLFPETVSRRKRPNGWRQKGDKFLMAEDIRWNITYTERLLSEELWPIRDSGTLLRDWEEALPWIYMEYEWKNLVESLSGQISFKKIKGISKN